MDAVRFAHDVEVPGSIQPPLPRLNLRVDSTLIGSHSQDLPVVRGRGYFFLYSHTENVWIRGCQGRDRPCHHGRYRRAGHNRSETRLSPSAVLIQIFRSDTDL